MTSAPASRRLSSAVLDEAQRAPELFSYRQSIVDRDRRPGRFVLAGSQQFGLLPRTTQSLAGRIGLVHLLPLSLAELDRATRPGSIEQLLWRGPYPPAAAGGVPPGTWYAGYMATYVERDVRRLVNVRDLGACRRFVRMCSSAPRSSGRFSRASSPPRSPRRS